MDRRPRERALHRATTALDNLKRQGVEYPNLTADVNRMSAGAMDDLTNLIHYLRSHYTPTNEKDLLP